MEKKIQQNQNEITLTWYLWSTRKGKKEINYCTISTCFLSLNRICFLQHCSLCTFLELQEKSQVWHRAFPSWTRPRIVIMDFINPSRLLKIVLQRFRWSVYCRWSASIPPCAETPAKWPENGNTPCLINIFIRINEKLIYSYDEAWFKISKTIIYAGLPAQWLHDTVGLTALSMGFLCIVYHLAYCIHYRRD